MSYRGPKVKLSRRLGVPLTEKAIIVMARRPHPPGEHGRKHRRASSEFGKQLLEKQKLKFQYNVSERQLRNYFAVAKRSKGNTAESFVQILESRLDSLVYRSGFAPSIYAARQLVTHGHVLVDGQRVTKPGYLVKSSNAVTIREKSKSLPLITEAVQKCTPPPYIERDAAKFVTKLASAPKRTDVPSCAMSSS